MTTLSSNPADLVKLPVFGFHEMLRLLEGRHGTTALADRLPAGLFHMVTSGEGGVAALLTFHPDGPSEAVELDYAIEDLPWPLVNVARFSIGAAVSNSYAAAGRTLYPAVGDPARIRAAAELGVAGPIQSGLPASGTLRLPLRLARFETLLVWVTPARAAAPAAPGWVQADVEGGAAVLRWTPAREPDAYSYELRRDGELISPIPLRAAMWVDAAPLPGRHVYGVRTVSASGVASAETLRTVVV